jgi:hypothetical protein
VGTWLVTLFAVFSAATTINTYDTAALSGFVTYRADEPDKRP